MSCCCEKCPVWVTLNMGRKTGTSRCSCVLLPVTHGITILTAQTLPRIYLTYYHILAVCGLRLRVSETCTTPYGVQFVILGFSQVPPFMATMCPFVHEGRSKQKHTDVLSSSVFIVNILRTYCHVCYSTVDPILV